jgi:transposase
MGRHAKKDILEVSAEEIADIRRTVEDSDFPDRYKSILLTLIGEIITIKQTKRERQAQLERIRRMLDQKSEKRPGSGDTEHQPEASPSAKAVKNHGRHGVDDYRAARTVSHPHRKLQAGQVCPDCGHGTLQESRPHRFIRLIGNAPIEAEVHEAAQLRCSGCGKIHHAELPPEIGEAKADPSANAIVATFRYGLGVPHFRLATIQRILGVPLPPSTQYEMVEFLWTQAAPVFRELLHQAAGWPLMFVDDTPARILELLKDKEARKAAGERVGIFTTAVVAQHAGQEIHLFFTGRKHAGENLAELLNHREDDLPPPVTMSDALSRNYPKGHLTIVALCLVHGRRNFIDCEVAFPDESAYVIERIGQVYKHEKHIRQEGMDDQQRLAYHQAHSRKPMDEIKAYAEQKLATKEVEPNGVLGQAFQYLIKHWLGMTRFLEIPGAPLDNNVAERLIKRSIMHRKASLFFKTEDGAKVGDCLMSLIQTCMANGENPVDYLTVLQKNARHIAKNPHLWLPWNYRNTLRSLGPAPASTTETKSITTSA